MGSNLSFFVTNGIAVDVNPTGFSGSLGFPGRRADEHYQNAGPYGINSVQFDRHQQSVTHEAMVHRPHAVNGNGLPHYDYPLDQKMMNMRLRYDKSCGMYSWLCVKPSERQVDCLRETAVVGTTRFVAI